MHRLYSLEWDEKIIMNAEQVNIKGKFVPVINKVPRQEDVLIA
jgi:hypothetical protein